MKYMTELNFIMKYMTELNFIASSTLFSNSSCDVDTSQWLLDNHGN